MSGSSLRALIPAFLVCFPLCSLLYSCKDQVFLTCKMNRPGEFVPFLLTPLDCIVPPICPTLLICFRLSENQHCVSRLQRGIDILLSRLPFLSGEVVSCVGEKGSAGRMKVQMPGSSIRDIPMLSVKVHPDKRLPSNQPHEFEYSHVKPDVASRDQSYWPLPLLTNPIGPTPALRFQANLLTDGVLLGMSINHHIADATGFGIIIKLLAESCCAPSAQDVPTLPNGEIELELRDQLSRNALSLDAHQNVSGNQRESKFAAEISTKADSRKTRFSVPGLSTRSFAFSHQKVVRLRDACSSILPILLHRHEGSQNGASSKNNDLSKLLSSNNVLAAMLGFCIERARTRHAPSLPESPGVLMPVNLRPHLSPPLPSYYIGNAIRIVQVPCRLPDENKTFDHGIDTESFEDIPSFFNRKELLHVASIALQIGAAAKATRDEHIQGLLSNSHHQKDWNDTSSQKPGLWMSSWRHLPLYNLDFGPGIGQIDHFETQPGTLDGACVIMPADKNAGGFGGLAPWDVRLTLERKVMEYLVDDRIFRWALEDSSSPVGKL